MTFEQAVRQIEQEIGLPIPLSVRLAQMAQAKPKKEERK